MTQDIDWAGIRAASVTLGIRAAARAATQHLPEDEQERFVMRVLKRAARESWVVSQPKGEPVRGSIAKPMSSPVLTGAETMVAELQNLNERSRLGYARTSVKISERFSAMDPDELIACTPAVKDGVVIADKTFGWSADRAADRGHTLVQIAIAGTAPVAVEHSAGPATTDVAQ